MKAIYGLAILAGTLSAFGQRAGVPVSGGRVGGTGLRHPSQGNVHQGSVSFGRETSGVDTERSFSENFLFPPGANRFSGPINGRTFSRPEGTFSRPASTFSQSFITSSPVFSLRPFESGYGNGPLSGLEGADRQPFTSFGPWGPVGFEPGSVQGNVPSMHSGRADRSRASFYSMSGPFQSAYRLQQRFPGKGFQSGFGQNAFGFYGIPGGGSVVLIGNDLLPQQWEGNPEEYGPYSEDGSTGPMFFPPPASYAYGAPDCGMFNGAPQMQNQQNDGIGSVSPDSQRIYFFAPQMPPGAMLAQSQPPLEPIIVDFPPGSRLRR